jgi:DNA-binding NarL/FixJ family response regulator
VLNLDPELNCVWACDCGEQALKWLSKQCPDVVLMDLQLPGISGVECTARMKELQPSVQIIMVTVYEDEDRVFRALRAGACGYLLKRSTPAEILGAIREVREGGAPMTSAIARKVIASFQKQTTHASELETLTAREREVLEALARGFANKEIAQQLGVTVAAVRWHLLHIYHKLHVRSRTEALAKLHAAKND